MSGPAHTLRVAVCIVLMSRHNSQYANAGATLGRLELDSQEKEFMSYGRNNEPHIHGRRTHMARQLSNANQSNSFIVDCLAVCCGWSHYMFRPTWPSSSV
jgi:hypothetical protein